MINFKSIPFIYKLGLRVKHKIFEKKTISNLAKYLNSNVEKKIQLGAGQNKLAGWFNTDYFPRTGIFFLDVTKAYPIAEDSFDFAFSEHHIEHIEYHEAQFMVKEVFRVLKIGGVFRICTPDLSTYLKTYDEKDSMDNPFVINTLNDWIKPGFYKAKNYNPTNGEENISFFINDIFLNYDHKFIYDFNSLKALLLNAGFSRIVQLNASKSTYPALAQIETHSPTPFTLTVEAIK